MEIVWHNNACFSIKNKDTTLVINPDKKAGKLKGEVVLSSLGEGETAAVEGVVKSFEWPGEYEVRDIPVKAIAAAKTVIFCFQFEGMKVCHLGNLGEVLSSEMLEKIGDVDVLMVTVGKDSNLDNKKATEVIEGIEPRVIIPMGGDDVEVAISKVWSDKIENMEKFVIKSATELPEDKTKCLVLNRP